MTDKAFLKNYRRVKNAISRLHKNVGKWAMTTTWR